MSILILYEIRKFINKKKNIIGIIVFIIIILLSIFAYNKYDKFLNIVNLNTCTYEKEVLQNSVNKYKLDYEDAIKNKK